MQEKAEIKHTKVQIAVSAWIISPIILFLHPIPLQRAHGIKNYLDKSTSPIQCTGYTSEKYRPSIRQAI
jgi:hypothetical protein